MTNAGTEWRERPSWLGRIASIAGWCCALIAAITLGLWLIGRVVNDRYAWSQWLWWIPTFAAIGAAMLGLLAACRPAARRRRRRRIATWGLFAPTLMIYWATFEHRLFRAAPTSKETGLKLVHWNMTLDNNADIEALMKWVDDQDADVAVLTSPPYNVATALLRRAQERGEPQPAWFGPLVVVTNLPVITARPLIAVDRTYIVLLELDAGAALGQSLVIYAIDLPSNPRIGRMALARKTGALLDGLRAPAPDVVVGDFNITRGSASLHALFPDLRHAFDEAGYGYGASFHRALPLYHIDHVLLGEHLAAARYDLIDPNTSRHRAQVVRLEAR